jgi:hypothetical protein
MRKLTLSLLIGILIVLSSCYTEKKLHGSHDPYIYFDVSSTSGSIQDRHNIEIKYSFGYDSMNKDLALSEVHYYIKEYEQVYLYIQYRTASNDYYVESVLIEDFFNDDNGIFVQQINYRKIDTSYVYEVKSHYLQTFSTTISIDDSIDKLTLSIGIGFISYNRVIFFDGNSASFYTEKGQLFLKWNTKKRNYDTRNFGISTKPVII